MDSWDRLQRLLDRLWLITWWAGFLWILVGGAIMIGTIEAWPLWFRAIAVIGWALIVREIPKGPPKITP